MGCYATYCCFCSYCFRNAREDRRGEIECDPEKYEAALGGEPGLSFTDIADRVIQLTEDDGAFWEEATLIGPDWPSYVSGPCYVEDQRVYTKTQQGQQCYWMDHPVLVIHRTCLSLLCRRLGITPKRLWHCFGDFNSLHRRHAGEWSPGTLWDIKYYDMSTRAGQGFEYLLSEDGYDYCNWLLASPAVFPELQVNPVRTFKAPDIRPRIKTAAAQVLTNTELFFMLLDSVVPSRDQADLEQELLACTDDDPLSLVQALRTLLNLMQVGTLWYRLITQRGQGLFFRLAWQFGWMLPACTEDWRSWDTVNGSLPPVPETKRAGLRTEDHATTSVNDKDWRAFVLTFMRKEDRNVRSRYRFHRMYVQFARGHDFGDWSWGVGRLGMSPLACRPTPYKWESRSTEVVQWEEEEEEEEALEAYSRFKEPGRQRSRLQEERERQWLEAMANLQTFPAPQSSLTL